MADVFSRLPFARSSVVEADLGRDDSKNDQTTGNTVENGSTGSLSDANRPGPSAFSGKNSSLNFQSVSLPTVSDSVATPLTGSSSADSGDSRSEMGDPSQSRGTTALKTGISAICTGNSSPLSATRPVANPDSYQDTMQSVQKGFCCTIPANSVAGPWAFRLAARAFGHPHGHFCGFLLAA